MALLAGFRAEKLLTDLTQQSDLDSAPAKKTIQKLTALGSPAIPKIVEKLSTATGEQTLALVDLLRKLLNNDTLPDIAAGLMVRDPRVVAGVAWALTTRQTYDPNRLLVLLDNPAVAKASLIEVLSSQAKRLNAPKLLQHAYKLDASEKAELFRILEKIADKALLPDLLSRLTGKDVEVRVHIISLLARFNQPEVSEKLQQQLRDDDKRVREAALSALAKMGGTVSIGLLCSLLQDKAIDVQNRAVDMIVKLDHPETVKHLVAPLKDRSEYTRRAAVEVLNHIGNAESVKYLLDAAKDDSDWWVAERAADAMVKIGGPRVVSAVLELIKDEDTSVRRRAIEILIKAKDKGAANYLEPAVDYLIEALHDRDWWVRERAVDAIAEIGGKKALPELLGMLEGDARTVPVVLRAIGTLAGPQVIDQLLPQLSRPEAEIKMAAMAALAKLADDARVEAIRSALRSERNQATDSQVQKAAGLALDDIDARYSPTAMAENVKAEQLAGHTRTLLIEEQDVEALIAAETTDRVLDVSKLSTGDVIDNRYRFIQRIGKGAFGTVLLMEDSVVGEQLILKFLNPAIASDEESVKRFVHELRYSRKITHKNVIRIYDFLSLGGLYAISMEYFPSHTLGAELDGLAMKVSKAVSIATDIANGMMVAHQVGIVHRDLKPANILINDAGLVKIVDFGVAAAQTGDTQLTKTGYVIGSPKYMAPEQILGKKIDQRADIYSSGILLYEMLTGRPPYTTGDHMAIMYQHVQGGAAPANKANPRVPQELADAVAKAMAVDKLKRYQSMEKFRDALREFMDLNPVEDGQN